MKKLLIILVAAVAGVTVATAQEALAVLTHGTTTKTFTGYYALQNAYAAATHGDLITLSSGTFGAVNLAKTITVRGAGMEQDKTYGTQPTIIDGNFTLCVPDTIGGIVTVEGIYHNGVIYYNNYAQRGPKFIKCRLNSFWLAVTRKMEQATRASLRMPLSCIARSLLRWCATRRAL